MSIAVKRRGHVTATLRSSGQPMTVWVLAPQQENTTMQDMQESNPSVQSHLPAEDTTDPTVRAPLSGPVGDREGVEATDRPAIIAVEVTAAQASGDLGHPQVTTQTEPPARRIE